MKHLILVGAALLSLAACATPSAQISGGLQRYGLDASRAQCVGDRLQRRLSLGQLQQLGNAANAYRRDDTDPTRLTVSDLIRVAGEIEDPKVVLEVGGAAAACNVLPAAPVIR